MMNRILIPVSLFMFAIGLYMVGVSHRPWAPRSDVEQPIPFSHRVHAGINKIPCQYCHEYARRSANSGVPRGERCVGCHGSALLGGIEPVTRPWTDQKQPPFEIRWNRVYALPDFVRFVHKPHIWAGVQCQECHGAVETMNRGVPGD